MSQLRIIDGATVQRLLDMPGCIDVMSEAMTALSSGAVNVPLRTFVPLAGAGGSLALMPGSSAAPPAFGAKLLSVMPDNPSRGLPTIQGIIILFDGETGAPAALVDGAAVTAIRTAAASGLATRLLARADARTHGILGGGVQALVHVEAILAARPDIRETLIWNRDGAKAVQVAEEADRRWGVRVVPVATAAEAAACDVVSTVTRAHEPILKGAWLRPGAHINLVGAHNHAHREADTDAVRRAEVFVDVHDNAMAESGDLLIPMAEGAFGADHIRGEIGALAAGRTAGRSGPEAVTLYKSLGTFGQDLYAAWAVLERARREDAGAAVTWP